MRRLFEVLLIANWEIMDNGLATLVAALVAAFSGVLSLIITSVFNWSSVQRNAHRDLLSPYMSVLSKELHQIIACSDMISKSKTTESLRNWHDRALESQRVLKSIRVELRYPLWGIDIGIHTLVRLPNWVENTKRHPRVTDKLLAHGDKLGNLIDLTILDCYKRGLPPRYMYKFRIKRRAEKLRNEFKKFGDERKARIRGDA